MADYCRPCWRIVFPRWGLVRADKRPSKCGGRRQDRPSVRRRLELLELQSDLSDHLSAPRVVTLDAFSKLLWRSGVKDCALFREPLPEGFVIQSLPHRSIEDVDPFFRGA